MIFCQQRQRQEMAGIQPGAIHPSTLWIWWTYTQWCWLVFHGYLTNSSWNSKNYVRLLKPTCDQLENTQQVAAPRPLQCQQNQWWTRTLQYLGHFWWKCAKVSIDPGLSPAKNHRMMFAGWCRHFLYEHPFTSVITYNHMRVGQNPLLLRFTRYQSFDPQPRHQHLASLSRAPSARHHQYQCFLQSQVKELNYIYDMIIYILYIYIIIII